MGGSCCPCRMSSDPRLLNPLVLTDIAHACLQVTHLLGKPLLRVFGQMRRILEVEPGWGLNIVPPPVPRSPQVRPVAHRPAHRTPPPVPSQAQVQVLSTGGEVKSPLVELSPAQQAAHTSGRS